MTKPLANKIRIDIVFGYNKTMKIKYVVFKELQMARMEMDCILKKIGLIVSSLPLLFDILCFAGTNFFDWEILVFLARN